jgi:hypothetical protein
LLVASTPTSTCSTGRMAESLFISRADYAPCES